MLKAFKRGESVRRGGADQRLRHARYGGARRCARARSITSASRSTSRKSRRRSHARSPGRDQAPHAQVHPRRSSRTGIIGRTAGDARGLQADRLRRGSDGAGADHGRERHRQGARRARDPRARRALGASVRGGQLRRHHRDAARVGAVRPRPRRLHRRRRRSQRACSSRRTAARCFSTKSARCRRRCR